MSYVVLGHATEEEREGSVPDGCCLVLAEECGVQGTFPHYLYSILSDPANKALFDDPVKHKQDLETLLKKPLAIYTSGEACPFVSYTLVNHSKNKDSGEENVYNVEPSGLYSLPADESNWAYHDKKKGIGRYTHKIVGAVKKEDIELIYRGAVFPTISSVAASASVSASVSVPKFAKLPSVRVSQTDLFARFPGIHFNFLCRSMPTVDSEIDRILSTYFPRVSIFTEDSFNRAGTVTDWLSALSLDSLTEKQKEGVSQLRTIVDRVHGVRALSAPRFGPTLLENQRLDRLLRLIQLGGDEAVAIIASSPVEFLNRVDVHNGYTPLAAASVVGNLPIVQQLLAKGVNANLADYDGATPLMLACSGSHGPVVGALLEGGSLPSVAANDGVTAVHIAAGDKHLVGVFGAILAGSDPNMVDDDGDTPLHVAASNCVLPNVALLLERGSDVNIRNSQRRTALIEAIAENCEECALALAPLTDHDLNDGTLPVAHALNEGLEGLAIKMLSMGVKSPELSKILAFAKKTNMSDLVEYITKLNRVGGTRQKRQERHKTRKAQKALRRRSTTFRRLFQRKETLSK